MRYRILNERKEPYDESDCYGREVDQIEMFRYYTYDSMKCLQVDLEVPNTYTSDTNTHVHANTIRITN